MQPTYLLVLQKRLGFPQKAPRFRVRGFLQASFPASDAGASVFMLALKLFVALLVSLVAEVVAPLAPP